MQLKFSLYGLRTLRLYRRLVYDFNLVNVKILHNANRLTLHFVHRSRLDLCSDR